LLKSQASVVVDSGGRVAGARIGDEVIHSGVVISSVPWHAMDRLWADGPPASIAPIVKNAVATMSSPIVTVNLWFDRPLPEAARTPFVGLVNGPMHWVFHKSAIFSGRAEHVAVVASGADDIVRLDNDALAAMAVDQMNRALPPAAERRLVRSVVVREHRATFSLAPGGPPRPQAVTPLPGFFLAGDWTDTGLPGTIEGAVQSGHVAAAHALK
jgi:predicted NAD/FAD-dependent oxidoreductase